MRPFIRRARSLRGLAAIVALVGLVSCSHHDRNRGAASARPLTEARRDSLIGASKLPGAAGVAKALALADSARARADRSVP